LVRGVIILYLASFELFCTCDKFLSTTDFIDVSQMQVLQGFMVASKPGGWKNMKWKLNSFCLPNQLNTWVVLVLHFICDLKSGMSGGSPQSNIVLVMLQIALLLIIVWIMI
jgi:hypothetical protein